MNPRFSYIFIDSFQYYERKGNYVWADKLLNELCHSRKAGAVYLPNQYAYDSSNAVFGELDTLDIETGTRHTSFGILWRNILPSFQ